MLTSPRFSSSLILPFWITKRWHAPSCMYEFWKSLHPPVWRTTLTSLPGCAAIISLTSAERLAPLDSRSVPIAYTMIVLLALSEAGSVSVGSSVDSVVVFFVCVGVGVAMLFTAKTIPTTIAARRTKPPTERPMIRPALPFFFFGASVPAAGATGAGVGIGVPIGPKADSGAGAGAGAGAVMVPAATVFLSL